MTALQGTLLAILGAAILLFLWNRWRHDLVAVAGLLAAAAGFGHPAGGPGGFRFGDAWRLAMLVVAVGVPL